MSIEIDQSAEGNNNQQVGVGNINNFNVEQLVVLVQKKLPSHIGKIVLVLNNFIDTIEIDSVPNTAIGYQVQEKIAHNNLIKYKIIIENYGIYGSAIDSCYNTLEEENPSIKVKFLRYLNSLYLIKLGDFLRINDGVDKIEVIRQEADNIIDQIKDELKDNYTNTEDANALIPIEELEICLNVIVCKGFIDCKILERP